MRPEMCRARHSLLLVALVALLSGLPGMLMPCVAAASTYKPTSIGAKPGAQCRSCFVATVVGRHTTLGVGDCGVFAYALAPIGSTFMDGTGDLLCFDGASDLPDLKLPVFVNQYNTAVACTGYLPFHLDIAALQADVNRNGQQSVMLQVAYSIPPWAILGGFSRRRGQDADMAGTVTTAASAYYYCTDGSSGSTTPYNFAVDLKGALIGSRQPDIDVENGPSPSPSGDDAAGGVVEGGHGFGGRYGYYGVYGYYP